MKRLLVVHACAILVAGSPVFADFYGFNRLTNNAAQSLTGQLLVEVTDAGAGKASFKFTNNVGIASNISEIYFDDGPFLGISAVAESAGVDFSKGATPGDLPGGENASPPFHVTQGFLASADNPSPQNGINGAADWVTITFDLINGKTFADTIAALNDGDLRIGLHIQAIGTSGKSDSYINSVPQGPNPIPAPGASALGLIGLACVVSRRVRHTPVCLWA